MNQAQRGRRSFSFHRPGKFQQLAQRMRAKVGGLFVIIFNPFHVTNPFRYPRENFRKHVFLKFSGGIERDYWHEMG